MAIGLGAWAAELYNELEELKADDNRLIRELVSEMSRRVDSWVYNHDCRECQLELAHRGLRRSDL
ncbi:hypothetical protein [Lentzea aerocolonigenes]|uniref:hypothetical protein n=1 Tax=Lentzea aerocolonigenes TaxID=68170 RepID=UPI000A4D0566|nr:hypothetical protein [Lentzea aerocolonigenes]